MSYFFKRWIILTLIILGTSYLFDGIVTDSFTSALLAALLLGFLNLIIKPILVLITLPFTILSLGFFLLIINALILEMVDYFVAGFHVHGFWTAFWGAIVISLGNWVFNINDNDNRSIHINFTAPRRHFGKDREISGSTTTIDMENTTGNSWK